MVALDEVRWRHATLGWVIIMKYQGGCIAMGIPKTGWSVEKGENPIYKWMSLGGAYFRKPPS